MLGGKVVEELEVLLEVLDVVGVLVLLVFQQVSLDALFWT